MGGGEVSYETRIHRDRHARRPGPGEMQRQGGCEAATAAAPTSVSPPASPHTDWLRAGREGMLPGTHHFGCERNAETLRLPRGVSGESCGRTARASASERRADGLEVLAGLRAREGYLNRGHHCWCCKECVSGQQTVSPAALMLKGPSVYWLT